MSRTTHRIHAVSGFVLHSYPFRETSLIVECWTEEHGRVPLVARGARRPHSALRGQLQAFMPLLLDWSGKNELRTLHRAEWQGGMLAPRGMALLCGFYINELMLKLLARDDPHPVLFAWYHHALQQLTRAEHANQCAIILRQFEQQLLQELGYAQPFTHDALHHQPIRAELGYHYQCERGAIPISEKALATASIHAQARTSETSGAAANSLPIRGKTLLDLSNHDYNDPVSLAQAKQLMRFIINHHLGGQLLHARELLKDLQQL